MEINTGPERDFELKDAKTCIYPYPVCKKSCDWMENQILPTKNNLDYLVLMEAATIYFIEVAPQSKPDISLSIPTPVLPVPCKYFGVSTDIQHYICSLVESLDGITKPTQEHISY